MVKKRTAALLLALLACTLLPTRALAKSSPWEGENIPIYVADTFSEFTDGEINFLAEPFWAGVGSGTGVSPFTGAWQEGKLVITGTPEGFTENFRFQSAAMAAASGQGEKAEGIGFYVENNAQRPQQIDFYMIGASGCYSIPNGKPIFTASLTGDLTRQDGYAEVPAGFKGYIYCYLADFENAWAADRPWAPPEDYIAFPGFSVLDLELTQGETFVIDNIFYFGGEVEDNNSGTIEITKAQAPTPTPAPAQTEKPGASATPAAAATETAPPAANETGSLVYYIIIGVSLAGTLAVWGLFAYGRIKNSKGAKK